MRQIRIHSESIRTGAEFTSKGNQKKWYQDGYWYKANQFGYEGIAEALCSELLVEMTAEMEQPLLAPVTRYEPVELLVDGKQLQGCRSRDFRREGWQLIPLERLYRAHTGQSASEMLAQIRDTKQRIKHLVDFVVRSTGLEDFGAYLTLMLEMDALFLNEDRHLNNIAVLWNAKADEYDYCPYYDMGLSLFADTREDFPLDLDYEACRGRIHSKPFDRDFDVQLDAAQELYGYHLKFPWSGAGLRKTVEKFFDRYPEVDERIRKRVVETVVMQGRRYFWE